MEKIICFGDSNTFGYNPEDGSRYDSNTRWTSVLAQILGDKYKVVEEGCNNRTGFFKNSDGLLQSGQQYLPQCLEKHKQFEVFILALGTNDLQKFFNINEKVVEDGLKSLINTVRTFNQRARIIIIPPVVLNEKVLGGYFNFQFDENSITKSVWIQKIYEIVTRNENCELLDLNRYVTPSNIDGLHFLKEAHKIIAEQIAQQILSANCKAESVEHC